jgi:hypothetical protein
MGIVRNISATKFPKQGSFLGRRTKVCFNYDASKIILGVVIRDDAEEPYVTIIKLDDNRVVLATECMHSPFFPGE